jgi:hypothetical protein
LVQVPGVEPLQVWQSVATPPPHELVQHTLSTHVSAWGFCRHMALREQLPPAPWSASHWLVVRLQNHVLGQSMSDVHAPWQPVFVWLHGVVAPQAAGFCAGHVPLLHVTAEICAAFGTAPLQEAGAPHEVPFGTAVLQRPLWHVSMVQAFPSLGHGVPLTRFVCVQPVAGTHASALQGLPSSQFGGAPPWQTPPLHWSLVVQALPSLHDVADTGCAWHWLVASLHTPVLHWSVNTEQSRRPPPVQTPAWHASPMLQ